jgi:hypothetical protein
MYHGRRKTALRAIAYTPLAMPSPLLHRTQTSIPSQSQRTTPSVSSSEPPEVQPRSCSSSRESVPETSPWHKPPIRVSITQHLRSPFHEKKKPHLRNHLSTLQAPRHISIQHRSRHARTTCRRGSTVRPDTAAGEPRLEPLRRRDTRPARLARRAHRSATRVPEAERRRTAPGDAGVYLLRAVGGAVERLHGARRRLGALHRPPCARL